MGKGSAPRPFTNRAIFENNWDKIFDKQKTIDPLPKETPHKILKQSRIDTIGQNGNNGDHYEYELNKSTGEVEKRFTDGTSKPNGEQFGNESDSTES
jgi:hypothetical protein